MGCITCKEDRWKRGVCRCCELVDKDTKTRLVKYCSMCGVYLCRQCFKVTPKAIARRIQAFGKQIFA